VIFISFYLELFKLVSRNKELSEIS